MKRPLLALRFANLYTPFASFLGTGRMCSRRRRDLVSRWPRPARHRLVSIAPFDGSDGQISPDKNVNFHDATAAFTVSPEPGALSCRADLPGDSALYAVSVRRLNRFALRLPSDGPSRFRPCLRLVLVQMCNTLLQDSRTGDLHPISSRPCRAYTRCCSGSPKKLTPTELVVGPEDHEEIEEFHRHGHT
jgi:hypothetical protein